MYWLVNSESEKKFIVILFVTKESIECVIVYLILSQVPLYPQRISVWLNLLTSSSFPVMILRGVLMKSNEGFGLTVKWRNIDTVSSEVKRPDWAAVLAKSSIVIRGNRINFKTSPNTARWFPGVTGISLRWHFASAHLKVGSWISRLKCFMFELLYLLHNSLK